MTNNPQPINPDELARWIRENNQHYPEILQLIDDGYLVEIGPGTTRRDAEGNVFTFKVVIRDFDTGKVISRGHSHVLSDALIEAHLRTPER